MDRGAKRRICGAVLLAALAVGGIYLAYPRERGAAVAAAAEAGPRKVVARGRIEPESRVRTIQGPAGAVLARVPVREGDRVTAGTVLAETNTLRSLEAQAALGAMQVAEAERLLEQVKAPAKQADIVAQRAVVEQRGAELRKLRRDVERTSQLAARNVVAAELEDARRTDLERAQQLLIQAESALRSLTEVRAVDIAVATARVEVQKASLLRVEADLELNRIRAPIDGTVLTLFARAGEALTADGLLQLGDLTRLSVVAEVDEADVGRLRVGQSATITGVALATPVAGVVERIAGQVFRQKRPTSDILIGRDARIVEVEVRPEGALPAIVGSEVLVDFSSASQTAR